MFLDLCEDIYLVQHVKNPRGSQQPSVIDLDLGSLWSVQTIVNVVQSLSC